MGVMQCYRDGCNEIMCGISIHGMNLCGDCVKELEAAVEQWPGKMTKSELDERIFEFFDTVKGSYVQVDTKKEMERLLYRDQR